MNRDQSPDLPNLEELQTLSEWEFENSLYPKILEEFTRTLHKNSLTHIDNDLILHILRIIRNAMAFKLLKSIEKRKLIIEIVLKLYPIIFNNIEVSEFDSETLLGSVTCSLQVFINNFACRSNDSIIEIHLLQQVVSTLIEQYGSKLLTHQHHKISSYTALLFSYSVSAHDDHIDWDSLFDKETVSHIVNKLLSTDDNNFLIFLESILKCKPDVFAKHYLSLNMDQRYFLIEFLDSLDSTFIHQDILLFLAAVFSNQSESLISRAANNCPSVRETLAILNLIAKLSNKSKDEFPLLARDGVFIKSCVNTLKFSIEEGKNNPGSSFATVNKCSDSHNAENSLLNGLKKNIIACLGNLANGDRENQTLIGQELNALPLILSCTSIDDRNPFIQQWAVLAVKSIVENHEDNKKILSGIHTIY